MTITRRDVAFPAGGNVSSLSITVPATVQVGDLMLLAWAIPYPASTQTDPAGWTLLGAGEGSNTNMGVKLYSRVAQSGDAGSTVTCTITSGATRQVLSLAAYYGTVGSVSVDGSALTLGGSTTMPAVTTSAASCVTIGGAAIRNTGIDTWTPPAGFTELGESASSGTGGKTQTIAENLTPVSSGTNVGGGTFTASVGGTNAAAWTVALKESSGGSAATAAGGLAITGTAVGGGALTALEASMSSSTPAYSSHRGGAGILPPNTMTAFAHPINDRFVLESDIVVVASDGTSTVEQRMAMSHDTDLSLLPYYGADGVTPQTGSLYDRTRAQFDTLRVPWPGWTPGDTTRPTPAATSPWEDLATFLQARPTRISLIESKHTAAVQAIIDSVKARGLVEQVLTNSFTWEHCVSFAAAGLHALWITSSFATHSAAEVYAAGIRHVGIQYGGSFASLATAAHAAGLKVWCWTLTSTSQRDTALAQGADGIITDRPDLVNDGTLVAGTAAGSLAVTGAAAPGTAAARTAAGTLTLTGAATARAAATAAGTLALTGTASATSAGGRTAGGTLVLTGTATAHGAAQAAGSLALVGVAAAGQSASASAHGAVTLVGYAVPDGIDLDDYPRLTFASIGPSGDPFTITQGGSMRLDPRAREYASWDVKDVPETGSLEVSYDGSTWHPLERDGSTVRVLVAGPDAPTDEPAAVVLTLGRNVALVRATAAPQIIIRNAGPIDVR